MIAFFLNPIGRYIAIASLLASLAWGVIIAVKRHGAEQAIIAVERANQSARDAADQGQRGVTECRGVWNRETGRCDAK